VFTPSSRQGGHVALIVILGITWFSLAFGGGYLLGQADAVTGNLGATNFAVRAAQTVGLHPPIPTTSSGTTLNAEQQARFRVFWEAWSLVSREFYDRAALDDRKMTYGAVKGMLESLGDSHTIFSTPEEKAQSDASLRGTFDGIGIQIDLKDGQLVVVAPLEDSPAQRAGVQAGDVIVQVDDHAVQGLALNDVVTLIRGPRGTSVKLSLRRAESSQPIVVTVERAEIKSENVRTRILDGQIGYVRIGSFNQTSGADTGAALHRLLDQGVHGVVLDLRSNPGGLLNAAVDVASQFMSDGVVLYQQGAGGERKEIRTRAGGAATALPLVILIDKGSASAAEIVAAALKENGRAVLFGEKSFGKGSVQSVHTLSDSSGIRVTTAIWLTPTGRPLEKLGIDPDQAVPAKITTGGAPDAAINAAAEYLQATSAAAEEPKGV
jgi:carboxyl-terminal processing protease